MEHPYAEHLITAADFLVDYSFADRLYPGALSVLANLRRWWRTVILTDVDVVFQPRKVQRFKRSVKMYVHPTRDQATGEIQTLEQAPVPAPWHHLRALLLDN
jgi:hypothetical protein